MLVSLAGAMNTNKIDKILADEIDQINRRF